MHRARSWSCFIVGGMVAACGADVDGTQELQQRDQAIVRGEETEAFPQVVMLHVQGNSRTSRCTGSYIAPRVVLTAAHCIPQNPIAPLSYIYFGDDEAPPFGPLPEIPAPGAHSELARVESFRVHPDYDAGVNYPDVAVVYLDRELPFAPLPLLTERVGRRYAGERATIVGWGGSRALVADISQVEGAGIKRRGQVTIVGTPTAADFHEDDPNPGMLDPAIRADSLKTNGRAPRSNGCAGDSGGPLLIKQNGRNYVAGVGYWTGLFCEDYGIWARIDPLQGFIRDAIKAAGRAPIVPRLDCVDQATDGTFTAFFGYESQNGTSVEIPHGHRNRLAADREGARPELFVPGQQPWAFSLPFSAGQRLSWELQPPAGPRTTVRADANSRRCECTAACDAALAAQCNPGNFSREACVAECTPFVQAFPGCQSELNAYWSCVSGLSPDPSNWVCDPSFVPQPMPPFCEAEFFDFAVCAG
ncbi:MAG: hypothetical protein RL033_4009 [Pseudomonadota bacterium]|jgi:hypothetical protein